MGHVFTISLGGLSYFFGGKGVFSDHAHPLNFKITHGGTIALVDSGTCQRDYWDACGWDSCTALVEDFDGSLRLLNWWDYLAGAEGQGSQKAGTDDESLIKQQGLLLNISSRLAGRNQQPR